MAVCEFQPAAVGQVALGDTCQSRDQQGEELTVCTVIAGMRFDQRSESTQSSHATESQQSAQMKKSYGPGIAPNRP